MPCFVTARGAALLRDASVAVALEEARIAVEGLRLWYSGIFLYGFACSLFWVESCRAVRGFRVEGLGLLDLRIRIYKSTVYREW